MQPVNPSATDLHPGEATAMLRDRSRNIPRRKRRRSMESDMFGDRLEERASIGSVLTALPGLTATFPFDQALPRRSGSAISGRRDPGRQIEPAPSRGAGLRAQAGDAAPESLQF